MYHCLYFVADHGGLSTYCICLWTITCYLLLPFITYDFYMVVVLFFSFDNFTYCYLSSTTFYNTIDAREMTFLKSVNIIPCIYDCYVTTSSCFIMFYVILLK